MPRPGKKSVDYFPHTTEHGKTMHIIEDRFGNDGYAFWFKLLERLGATDGHCLDLSDPIEMEYLISISRITEEKCIEILNLCSKIGAIDSELWENKRWIWSQNFVDGLAGLYQKRHTETPPRPCFLPENPPIAPVSDTETVGARARVEKSREKKSKAEKTRTPTSEIFCQRKGYKTPGKLYGQNVVLSDGEYDRMLSEWGGKFTDAAIAEYDARFNNKMAAVHNHVDHNLGIRYYVRQGYICSGRKPAPPDAGAEKPDWHVPPEDRADPEEVSAALANLTKSKTKPGLEPVGAILNTSGGDYG